MFVDNLFQIKIQSKSHMYVSKTVASKITLQLNIVYIALDRLLYLTFPSSSMCCYLVTSPWPIRKPVSTSIGLWRAVLQVLQITHCFSGQPHKDKTTLPLCSKANALKLSILLFRF